MSFSNSYWDKSVRISCFQYFFFKLLEGQWLIFDVFHFTTLAGQKSLRTLVGQKGSTESHGGPNTLQERKLIVWLKDIYDATIIKRSNFLGALKHSENG